MWKYNVNMRLKERFIARQAVLFSIDTYEIIESYPDDKYLPSFLIWAQYGKDIIHIHIATDFENEMVRIITAYKPTLEKWAKGFNDCPPNQIWRACDNRCILRLNSAHT